MSLKFAVLVFDCHDPAELTAFYLAAGGTLCDDGPRKGAVCFGGLAMMFQGLDDYQPPTWPDGDTPKQIHLDFWVDDTQTAEEELLSLGATIPEHQPHRATGLTVALDPAGHPFCIGTRS